MTKVDQALAYLAKGYSVIPLYPKSKVAMVQWIDFQKRLPTEAEVRGWFKHEPDANIGIVTGEISGFIVADVEGEKKGSKKGDITPYVGTTGRVVQTPSGGFHFWYRHPAKGYVKKGKPQPGTDRQSDGCYVVAPDSFVVTTDYEGSYAWLEDGEMGDPPACLFDDAMIEPPAATSGEAWIERVITMGCPPGTRNDTLSKLAGYFAGKGVPQDIIEPFLLGWAGRQLNTNVTEAEARRTIGSIYAKEHRKNPAKTGDYVVDEFVQSDESKPLEIMSLADFGARYYTESVQWLIPEWLPQRSVTFLVSPPGRFKTMLTFDAAISVAGGWPFMGQFPVLAPGPVLVIQQEDDYGDMARRFNRIFAARQPGRTPPDSTGPEDVTGHLSVCDVPPVHICTTRGFTLSIENLRRLEDAIRTIHPRVVIIDPLYSITSAEDFMMHAAKDMMPLKRLRDAYDCSFLIAAHTKKGAEQGREGLWGSQFLNAFMETGWQIRDQEDGEDNQIQVRRHFKSSAIPGLLNLEFQLDDNDGYRITVSDPEDEEPQDVILKELKKLGEATAEDIATAAGLSIRITQKRLKKFKGEGVITNGRKGERGSLTWTIPKDTTKDVADGKAKAG